MRATIQEKFDRRYTPEPNTGCWLWIGAVDTAGYGRLGEKVRAHRLSFCLASGIPYQDLPSATFICHRCDVPSCVNPAHLYAGTPADNMRDKVARGRMRGHFTAGYDPRRKIPARAKFCRKGHERRFTSSGVYCPTCNAKSCAIYRASKGAK